MSDQQKSEFEEASAAKPRSLPGELWLMLKHNKKYWLIPLLIGLLALGVIVVLGSTAAAPFIYTLF